MTHRQRNREREREREKTKTDLCVRWCVNASQWLGDLYKQMEAQKATSTLDNECVLSES